MSEREFFSYPYRTREEFQEAFNDMMREADRNDPDGSARRAQAKAWADYIDGTIFADILMAIACGDPPFTRQLLLPRLAS